MVVRLKMFRTKFSKAYDNAVYMIYIYTQYTFTYIHNIHNKNNDVVSSNLARKNAR